MQNAKTHDAGVAPGPFSVIDALILISQRPVVIALALFGAALVIAGSLTAKPIRPKEKTPSPIPRSPLSKNLTTAGYAITGASILLFIIAGFVSDLGSPLE